jgi:hemolysin III
MAPNPPKQHPPLAVAPRVKPRLRGVSHEIAAYLAVPAAAALVATARGGSARAAAVTYGASVFILFAVSAFYHRPFWTPAWRNFLGRLDHAAIFILIAGTYTPLCLLIGPGAGYTLLAVAWGCATVGIVVALAWGAAPKKVMATVYVLFGWLLMPIMPALRAALGDGPLLLVLAGGLAYTAGAVIYAVRRPDPFPVVFGYHEIFHLLVVGAAACHFVVVAQAIRSMT